jgi:hypothetical protein
MTDSRPAPQPEKRPVHVHDHGAAKVPCSQDHASPDSPTDGGLRAPDLYAALRPFLQPNGTYLIPNTTAAVASIGLAVFARVASLEANVADHEQAIGQLRTVEAAARRYVDAAEACRVQSEAAIETKGATTTFEEGFDPLSAALVEFGAAEDALRDALTPLFGRPRAALSKPGSPAQDREAGEP